MRRDDAERVMQLFVAGFPSHAYTDESALLYETALQKGVGDSGVAFAVATDWVMSRTTFPKLAELVEECRTESLRRQRRADAVASGIANGGICPTCDDIRMVEMEGQAAFTMIPCPTCRADEHRYHADGHYDLFHPFTTCDHPRCAARSTEDRARRDGGFHPLGTIEARRQNMESRPSFHTPDEAF